MSKPNKRSSQNTKPLGRQDVLEYLSGQQFNLRLENGFSTKEIHLARCAEVIKSFGTLPNSENLDCEKRALKSLVMKLIRVSSESDDYRVTVDFISDKALDKAVENSETRVRCTKGALETGIRHEHMYPCASAYEKLANGEVFDIRNFLFSTGFRALIAIDGDETTELKTSLKSRLPDIPGCPAPSLSRYCKSGPCNEKSDLAIQMKPITERAEYLLTQTKQDKNDITYFTHATCVRCRRSVQGN